jgi:hypothetical protein
VKAQIGFPVVLKSGDITNYQHGDLNSKIVTKNRKFWNCENWEQARRSPISIRPRIGEYSSLSPVFPIIVVAEPALSELHESNESPRSD